MCMTCGCAETSGTILTDLQTGEHLHMGEEWHQHAGDHAHGHSHDHSHVHSHGRHEHENPDAAGDGAREQPGPAQTGRTIRLERQILDRNNHLAERNRGWFAGRNVLALNFMSSPGAGKTTLLERTIQELGRELNIHVIEGDQRTLWDAERIRRAGAPVLQINTGAACHLDAEMIGAALRKLNPPAGAALFIENVGNLVCPALFDLGEAAKIVVASVTEGDDKPAKYPHMFRAADLIVLNKSDLLPHVQFDQNKFLERARQANPKARMLLTSATQGDGLAEWYDWLRKERAGLFYKK